MKRRGVSAALHTGLPENLPREIACAQADNHIIRRAEQGKVGKMAEAADHLLVQQFFAARDLVAQRIEKTKTKTPDFGILRETDLVAYCEVKSPQDVFDERVGDAILKGRGGVIETGYGNDYRQGRCIARAAQKAVAQFVAVNPAHLLPNIMVIVNHDSFSLEDDFTQLITGELGALGRVGKPLRDDIPEIDVYVWMDATGNSIKETLNKPGIA
jgi:hypothetical protein